MLHEVRFGSIIAGFAGVLVLASTASSQVIPAGGKTTQATYSCTGFDASNHAVVTLTIPAGKKKRMIIVNAYARPIPLGAATCGLTMNLDFGAATDSFGGSANGLQGSVHTATGTWWADVDDLETQFPGQFIGEPIVLTMNVFKTPGDLCSGTCVSIASQLVKK
jgi:hypothetical protein